MSQRLSKKRIPKYTQQNPNEMVKNEMLKVKHLIYFFYSKLWNLYLQCQNQYRISFNFFFKSIVLSAFYFQRNREEDILKKSERETGDEVTFSF